MSQYDVAIIGGGPTGSTLATFLKQHKPEFKVLVLEREIFPRDHVGESQLPVVSGVLQEMGAWDKVEAAGFPIKIGATYKWGRTTDLWDFEFVPAEEFKNEPRPAKYEGPRKATAFQVDRAIYDEILLDHAAENGAEVREGIKVAKVEHEGDTVTGFRLEDGSLVTARYYVDASGHIGVLRRAMGVEAVEPAALRNVAFWDYWQNAEWAIEIGVGGTRVQVMSLGYGWMWFIPLGPTRTSVGLVCPAEYYKSTGMRPEEIYRKALAEEPRISELMKNAESENRFETTKDWSFYAERMSGENWFLAGESAGFADPILAAGLTIAQVGAKELAFTILELDRGKEDPSWLKGEYEAKQTRRIGQHIRFANYWYTANGQFTDLVNFTSEIAKEAGLDLDPQKAWQWLGTGGFIEVDVGAAGVGTVSLGAAKQISKLFDGSFTEWEISKYNLLDLDQKGAEMIDRAIYAGGGVIRQKGWMREGTFLPNSGVYAFLVQVLRKERLITRVIKAVKQRAASLPNSKYNVGIAIQALEGMITDGWIKASFDPDVPSWTMETPEETELIHYNKDGAIVAFP